MLTEADVKLLAELIANRPPVPSCVDMCKYEKQMDVLDRWIANDTARKERWEKIRAGIITGLVISAIGSLGTGSLIFVNYLRDHLK